MYAHIHNVIIVRETGGFPAWDNMSVLRLAVNLSEISALPMRDLNSPLHTCTLVAYRAA